MFPDCRKLVSVALLRMRKNVFIVGGGGGGGQTKRVPTRGACKCLEWPGVEDAKLVKLQVLKIFRNKLKSHLL